MNKSILLSISIVILILAVTFVYLQWHGETLGEHINYHLTPVKSVATTLPLTLAADQVIAPQESDVENYLVRNRAVEKKGWDQYKSTGKYDVNGHLISNVQLQKMLYD